MVELFRPVALVVIAVTCAIAAVGENAEGLYSGIWDVSTLVPGRGSVPPIHELHVEMAHWALRERNFSRVSRLLSSAAERLGVIYTAVPAAETTLCHAAPSLHWEWEATRKDDGLLVDCLPGQWLTPAALRTFEHDGFLHLRFDRPQPLSVMSNGACVATSWSLHDVALTAVTEDSVVVSGTLSDSTTGSPATCKAYFELTRRPMATAKETSPSSGVYTPIVMLLVVIAVRFLPRYVLTHIGQVDSSSYRGRNPGKLSSARRAELLQKQRRIIQQMKAQDLANGPKEKTS
ncbi:hypothetical protein NQL31_001467 [Lotmaria passim]